MQFIQTDTINSDDKESIFNINISYSDGTTALYSRDDLKEIFFPHQYIGVFHTYNEVKRLVNLVFSLYTKDAAIMKLKDIDNFICIDDFSEWTIEDYKRLYPKGIEKNIQKISFSQVIKGKKYDIYN